MPTPHLAMKFPSTTRNVIVVHVDQKMAKECYAASLRLKPIKVELEQTSKKVKGKEVMQSVNVVDLDPRTNEVRIESGEDVAQIHLQDNNHCTKLGISLKEGEINVIREVLIQNADMFAWTVVDMPGGDPEVISHRL